MKTKNILTGFIAIALFALLPSISLANTYQYVDTSGNFRTVQANSSSEALVTAHQLGIHSGVILVGQGGLTLPTGSGNYYYFVDINGNLQGLWAANSREALVTAHQLGIHSGVKLAK